MIKDLYEKLKADFPKEAMSADNSRGFELTSVKAQYIIERLNEVLGIDGWMLQGEFVEKDKGILYLGNLHIRTGPEKHHVVEAIGFSGFKKNLGDTYKSARTDALSKSSSYIGIANEVFKGNVDIRTMKDAPPPAENKAPVFSTAQKNKIRALINKHEPDIVKAFGPPANWSDAQWKEAAQVARKYNEGKKK